MTPFHRFISITKWMSRSEARDRYPSAWAAAGEAIGLGLSLIIYWYTARAFSSKSPDGFNYFDYLMIGETTFFVPLALFQGLPRSFRKAAAAGVFESEFVSPLLPQFLFLARAASLIPMELFRAGITLAVAVAFLGLALPGSSIGWVLLLQLLALPAFFGLGLLAIAALIRFGRGDSMLTYATAAATLLAGTYFPLEVLPPTLRAFSGAASPFSALLEGTRSVIHEGVGSPQFQLALTALPAWGFGLLFLGFLALHLSLARYRENGGPLYLSA